jgi:hypothetical protein
MMSTCLASSGCSSQTCHGSADLRQIFVELDDGDIAAQHGFVADDDAIDRAAVVEPGADGQCNFFRVVGLIRVDPHAERHVDAVTAGNGRNAVHAVLHRVGADAAGELRELLHVRVDLLGRDVVVLLLGVEMARAVRHAAELAVPVGRTHGIIPAGPEENARAHHQKQRNENSHG